MDTKTQPTQILAIQIEDAWNQAKALVEKLNTLNEQQKIWRAGDHKKFLADKKGDLMFDAFLSVSMCEQKLFKALAQAKNDELV